MRIIAIANGGFAIPTLRALKESRHELAAVIVMPLRTKRSGDKAGVPPVREAVKDFLADVPMYDPENINSLEGEALLNELKADLIFICDYGKILSKEVLLTTKLGGLNLHGSLLPKYRGAAPINRAIQAGDRELGVSVIFIEPKVDAGPIVATSSYTPSLEDTAVEIEETLAQMGAPLVLDAIDRIESNSFQTLVQNSAEATKAPKIRKEEGRIDWSKDSEVIVDQYRAFQPWPRVYSDWVRTDATNSITRVILGPFESVEKAQIAEICDPDFYNSVSCGTVIAVSKTSFWVKTNNGAICPLAIQPSGKKSMTLEVFLRGYRMQVGDLLQ